MTVFLAVAVLVAQAQFRVDVPAPEVHAASVESNGQCVVTIRNVHTRPAVAWIVMDRDGRAGGVSDRILPSPSLWLYPQQDHTEHYACRVAGDAAVPDVVVVALYDDATVSGDDPTIRAAVNTHLLEARMRAAAGLRAIAQLVQARRLQSANRQAVLQELKETIEHSDGWPITPVPRAAALHALASLGSETSAERDGAWHRAELVRKLGTLASQLEALQPDKEGV